ncbi:MAG: hypothetical protein KGK03_03920 [Candidatus Omnitrophica bacterium]|nr:hypothetical protein [Candidatus Omnitrophota bacterium]
MFIERLSKALQAPCRPQDLFLLFLWSVLVLWWPSYLHQELNLFEWGLYLPGIDAVSHGLVPYRDFFHLRGPFELYAPALFMKIFGFRADVLAAYFYLGTVLTILVSILIAYELIPSRALLYSFVFILITRTFPRSVFTFWGGLRYVWGLLAVWCLVRFLKTKRPGWLMATGFLAAIGGGTSIEIGVISVLAFIAVMVFVREYRRWAWAFLSGFLVVCIPYSLYLLSQNAFIPYVQAQWVVVTHMQKTFYQLGPVPDTVPRFLHAMIFPLDKNFYKVTPIYCYIFFFPFYFQRLFHKRAAPLDHAALAVAVYGLGIFLTGFRLVGGPVYEMSLQPEKIVLFYLWVQAVGWIRQKYPGFKWTGAALTAVVVLSSCIYTIGRFKTRFYKPSWVCQLIQDKNKGKQELVNGQPAAPIDLPRIRHMTVPVWQAKDLEELSRFVNEHVPAHQAIWMYPELGSLNFILMRPWVGRFPVATLSWMDDAWFAEYESVLKSNPPKFAIVNKVMADCFNKVYFLVPANRVKHESIMRFLNKHYRIVYQTPSYFVYRFAG